MMNVNIINQIYMNNMENMEHINNAMNQININNKNKVSMEVIFENNPPITIHCFEDDKVSILRKKCNKIKGVLS